MKTDNKTTQMSINEEIQMLSKIDWKKELRSHSSANPDEYYFVKSDNAFTRKARFLQAIRRYQSGAACGSFVKDGITYFHPNLVNDGLDTGCNFLQPEIHEYAKERVDNKKKYETINKDRLFNNFLSSQPMAFNLFYPFRNIIKEDAGQVILADVVSKLIDQEKSLDIKRIYEVGIESIPEYYKDCLNDKTAMDAYFRYITADNKKGIIAIETKYSDSLGTNEASDPSTAITTATERDGVFQLFTNVAREAIRKKEIKMSQVYRNFLLTETVRLHENLEDSISIVIAPKENKSNKTDEKQLLDSLIDNFKYKFQILNLEDFVDAIIEEFPNQTVFKDFKHRYLDFQIAEYFLKQINN